MHLWFSPADRGDAEGRAGRAAAPGVGRGDAEPPPSRQWAPAGGKSGNLTLLFPRGAQSSSSVVTTVDSVHPHTDNSPQFN